MKKEVSTTPIILVMTIFIASIIFLLESAAFDNVDQKRFSSRRPNPKPFAERNNKLTLQVIRLVKPDSLQSIQIKELTSRSSEQLKRISRNSRQEKEIIMDSLKLQLRAILTDEQFKRLDEIETPFPRSVE